MKLEGEINGGKHEQYPEFDNERKWLLAAVLINFYRENGCLLNQLPPFFPSRPAVFFSVLFVVGCSEAGLIFFISN